MKVYFVCLVLLCVLPVVLSEGRYRDGVRQEPGSEKGDNSDVFDFIAETIQNNKVTIFSKSYCP